SSELRVRPALLKDLHHIASAAAEIDDRSRRCRWYARQQIERRSQSLAREFQILFRIPAHLRSIHAERCFAVLSQNDSIRHIGRLKKTQKENTCGPSVPSQPWQFHHA